MNISLRIEKKIIPKINNFEILFTLLIVFFSSQRYLLEDLNQYFCFFLYFFILRNFQKKNYENFLIYSILFLYISVDINIISSNFTPSFIRFPIYFLLIFLIIIRTKINFNILFLFALYLSFGIFIGLIKNNQISLSHLYQDILLLLFFFYYFNHQATFSNIDLNKIFKILSIFILPTIFGECINIFIFDQTHYVSLDSLKSLTFLPLIYSFFSRKYYYFLVLLIPSMLVLNSYSTRMIPLTLLIIFLLYFFINISFKNILYFLIFICFSIFAFNFIEVPYTKIIGIFYEYEFSIGENLLFFIKLLDPIRFVENLSFFNQDVVSILFGNGLGSGIQDTDKILTNLANEHNVYSQREIDSGLFYDLHDFHTDIGVRFGLLLLLTIVLSLIKNILLNKKNSISSIPYYLLLFLLPLVFFSTSGKILLLIITVLINSNYSEKRKSYT